MNKTQKAYTQAQQALSLALAEARRKASAHKTRQTFTQSDRQRIDRECNVPYYREKFQAARRSLLTWGRRLVQRIAPEATEVIDAMRDAGDGGGQEMIEILLKTEDVGQLFS